METVANVWNYAWPFLVTISVIVFVHELGHYLIARLNKVRVEVFSIGFGPELVGFNDSHGTRWKISALPLGGYVKFFGDANAASGAKDERTLTALTDEERRGSFHHKRVGQRAAIVVGGPLGNFIFAAIVLAILAGVVGERYSAPTIDQVMPGGAAEVAGLTSGDRIVEIDGKPIETFEQVQEIVVGNDGTPLNLVVLRNNAQQSFVLTPKEIVETDSFGNETKVRRLGVSRGPAEFRDVGVGQAIWAGIRDTYNVAASSLTAIGEMIVGKRSTDELGGPVKIGYMAGKIAQDGALIDLVLLVALLSVSLGLINLFPVPMLDGGHLIFYLWEGIVGRPLKPRIQEYSLRVGFVLVIALMVWVTSKDIIWQVKSGSSSGTESQKTEAEPSGTAPK
ncbi:MAG: RIP metalloprotease [Alphaproteobacteria bacterium]|nr:RIP metalloprotease [Alphaproteobacteria bacterium]